VTILVSLLPSRPCRMTVARSLRQEVRVLTSCFRWQYDATYFGRSDIKSAFADMSLKARAHAKTSCRQ
jgi:hypothetical protein